MPVELKNVTDPNLPEPIGASSAANKEVYVADGLGGGTWQEVLITDLDTGAATANQVFIADGAGGLSIANVADIVQVTFGEVELVGNSTATTITGANTFTEVVGTFIDGPMNNFTSTGASGNKLVVPATGTYRVDCAISFEGGTGVTWAYDLAINTATNNSGHAMRRKTSNSDVGSLSITGFKVLTSGDEIFLVVKDEATTSNPVITDAHITLSLIKAV